MYCPCGKTVRLRGYRISVNRRRGVAHFLEHPDGTPPCIDGEWTCAAFKPYPKDTEESEWRRLLARWELAAATAPGEEGA